MKKYQLFIGRYKELPKEEYTYYSPSSGYMLVYTNKYMSDNGFKKVLPEKESELPQDEKNWLGMIKHTINAKYLGQTTEEFAKKMNIFMDCLEKTLKEIKE